MENPNGKHSARGLIMIVVVFVVLWTIAISTTPQKIYSKEEPSAPPIARSTYRPVAPLPTLLPDRYRHVDESLAYATWPKRECYRHGYDFVGSDYVYQNGPIVEIECGKIVTPGQSILIGRIRVRPPYVAAK